MSGSAFPANISTANARLPATYEQARAALARCQKVDECKDWADKAAALASYAKQADDAELYMMARRIQGRAVQRCGELLREFDGRGGDQSKPVNGGRFARYETGRNAGLTERQVKTAVRVANVPAEQFEDWIESDTPPSVTKLAEAGKQSRPIVDYLQGRDPAQYYAATHTMGALRRLVERCEAHPPAFVAAGVDIEVEEMRQVIPALIEWLSAFLENLRRTA